MNKPWTTDETARLLKVCNEVMGPKFGFEAQLGSEKLPGAHCLAVDFSPIGPTSEDVLKPRTCGLIKYLRAIWGRPETIKAGPYNPWEEPVDVDALFVPPARPRPGARRIDAPPRPAEPGRIEFQYAVNIGQAQAAGNPFRVRVPEPDPLMPILEDEEDVRLYDEAVNRAEQEARNAVLGERPAPGGGGLVERLYMEARNVSKSSKKPAYRFKYSFVRNDSGLVVVGIF